MKPFFALISPVSGDEHPDQGLPPPTEGTPKPPAWAVQLPVFPDRYPDQGLPPGEPKPPAWAVQLPVFPFVPTHPIIEPGEPTHPIVLPPEGSPPAWAVQLPVFPDRGPDQGLPTPPAGPPESKFEWKTAWTEETGWVVVLVPKGEHVTPSKRR